MHIEKQVTNSSLDIVIIYRTTGSQMVPLNNSKNPEKKRLMYSEGDFSGTHFLIFIMFIIIFYQKVRVMETISFRYNN